MRDEATGFRQAVGDAPVQRGSPVIAINDAIDVLRHGWQDAAGTFAPEIPEIAELLQARLEMAVGNGTLDESHLLGAIEDVESMAASAGSSAGQTLARRLRRTVYEYLLALDAAPSAQPHPPSENGATSKPETVVVASAVVAVEHPDVADVASPAEPSTPQLDDVDGSDAPARRSRFSLRRRDGADGEQPVDSSAEDVAATDVVADALPLDPEDDAPAPPTWTYPAVAVAEPNDQAAEAPAAVAADAPEVTAEAPADGPADGDGTDTFVAPRPGFHIVEDTHPSHVPGDADASPLQMPAFAADEPAVADGAEAPAAQAASEADGATEVETENGWRVRPDPKAEGGRSRDRTAPVALDDDPFESNIRLADLRRRIDEKLRRKRCDEAAALLQELAQETGGRVVAELAMNAGDRCQSLGKSNAALNCYLAASRADPVYELPLSRLADICIDDQDTELAVSYLERIARLYRFRGDDRAALRVYRRIATIAPYREDVLAVLMNAQSTGRFDS
jgi:hypothetical protein